MDLKKLKQILFVLAAVTGLASTGAFAQSNKPVIGSDAQLEASFCANQLTLEDLTVFICLSDEMRGHVKPVVYQDVWIPLRTKANNAKIMLAVYGASNVVKTIPAFNDLIAVILKAGPYIDDALLIDDQYEAATRLLTVYEILKARTGK